MNWNNLYILPILALIACKLLPVFPSKKRNRRARHHRRGLRSHATTVSRWLVCSLLIGTLLTLLFPLQNEKQIVQGLVITVICMIPVLLFILFSSAKNLFGRKSTASSDVAPNMASDMARDDFSRASNSETAGAGVNQSTAFTMQPAAPANAQLPKAIAAKNAQSLFESSRDNLRRTKDPISSNEQDSSNDLDSQNADKYDEISDMLDDDTMLTGLEDTIVDEGVMQGQLHRVSTAVDNYELGGQQDNASLHERRKAESTAAVANVASDEPASNSVDTKGLDTSSVEKSSLTPNAEKVLVLNNKITVLQQDKKKLQRLVIAQQAAFDSERQSHERSRTVAKEAVKVMRDARESQRMATKIARVERSKRKNLEEKYKNVNKILVNVLSTLEASEQKNVKKRIRDSLGGVPAV